MVVIKFICIRPQKNLLFKKCSKSGLSTRGTHLYIVEFVWICHIFKVSYPPPHQLTFRFRDFRLVQRKPTLDAFTAVVERAMQKQSNVRLKVSLAMHRLNTLRGDQLLEKFSVGIGIVTVGLCIKSKLKIIQGTTRFDLFDSFCEMAIVHVDWRLQCPKCSLETKKLPEYARSI